MHLTVLTDLSMQESMAYIMRAANFSRKIRNSHAHTQTYKCRVALILHNVDADTFSQASIETQRLSGRERGANMPKSHSTLALYKV